MNPDSYSFGMILWFSLMFAKKGIKYKSAFKHFEPYGGSRCTISSFISLSSLASDNPKEYTKLFMRSINYVNGSDPLLNNILTTTLIGIPEGVDIGDIVSGEVMLDESHNYNFYHKLPFKLVLKMWDNVTL
jgi:hypothetical protein